MCASAEVRDDGVGWLIGMYPEQVLEEPIGEVVGEQLVNRERTLILTMRVASPRVVFSGT